MAKRKFKFFKLVGPRGGTRVVKTIPSSPGLKSATARAKKAGFKVTKISESTANKLARKGRKRLIIRGKLGTPISSVIFVRRNK